MAVINNPGLTLVPTAPGMSMTKVYEQRLFTSPSAFAATHQPQTLAVIAKDPDTYSPSAMNVDPRWYHISTMQKNVAAAISPAATVIGAFGTYALTGHPVSPESLIGWLGGCAAVGGVIYLAGLFVGAMNQDARIYSSRERFMRTKSDSPDVWAREYIGGRRLRRALEKNDLPKASSSLGKVAAALEQVKQYSLAVGVYGQMMERLLPQEQAGRAIAVALRALQFAGDEATVSRPKINFTMARAFMRTGNFAAFAEMASFEFLRNRARAWQAFISEGEGKTKSEASTREQILREIENYPDNLQAQVHSGLRCRAAGLENDGVKELNAARDHLSVDDPLFTLLTLELGEKPASASAKPSSKIFKKSVKADKKAADQLLQRVALMVLDDHWREASKLMYGELFRISLAMDDVDGISSNLGSMSLKLYKRDEVVRATLPVNDALLKEIASQRGNLLMASGLTAFSALRLSEADGTFGKAVDQFTIAKEPRAAARALGHQLLAHEWSTGQASAPEHQDIIREAAQAFAELMGEVASERQARGREEAAREAFWLSSEAYARAGDMIQAGEAASELFSSLGYHPQLLALANSD